MAGARSTRLTAREVAVVNAQGRSTMIPIDNPFTEMDELLDEGADDAARRSGSSTSTAS